MRRRGLVAVLLGVALVAGACGGDDDEASTGDESATTSDGESGGDDVLASVPAADGCTGDRAVEDMTCRGLTNGHVTVEPDYAFVPPVGGDHNPVWANCGLYLGVVPPAFAVHSMEHGAVWIAYGPDTTDDDRRLLDAMVDGDPKLLVSAIDDAPAPFVLSAWGVQRYVTSLDDPAVAAFVADHEDADTSPEPGFPCDGGQGVPDGFDDAEG